jgi:outer membrane protein assembly factor BamB
VRWSGRNPSHDRGIAVANGVIYSTSATDGLYAWNARGCGAPYCDPLWRGLMGSSSMTAPVVAGDVVYVGVDNNVLAFPVNGCGSFSCYATWSRHTTGWAISPIVYDGRIYVATDDGWVGAFGKPLTP